MGLEPTTNGLEVRYSIQLSYTPPEQEGQTRMPCLVFPNGIGIGQGGQGGKLGLGGIGKIPCGGGRWLGNGWAMLPWGWGDKTGRLHWAHGCLQFSGFSEFPETRGLE